jgi:hypothetical protein
MHSDRKKLVTRVVAVLAGVLVFVVALLIMTIGSNLFTGALWHHSMGHEWLRADENWPLVPGSIASASVVWWAYPACAGILTTALFWQGWPTYWRRALAYTLIVVLIAPMSWINYALSDQWLNVWIQTAFNLIMAIFFLMVVFGLRNIKSNSPDMLAIQSVGILMLSSFGVFLPLFYSCVFLAYASGMVTHVQIGKINDSIPLLFAGGAGAIVTFLGQLEKLRGDREPFGNPPINDARQK